MNFSASILSGVIGGVITAILIWVIYGLLYKKIFLPWLENILYQGVFIRGRWQNKKSKGKSTDLYEMIFEIEQNGYDIYGTFFAKSVDDATDTNYYSFKGKIINNYLVGNYRVSSKEKLGLGTFLLKIDEGGLVLVGSIVFVDEVSMNISAFEDIKFTKL